MGGEEALKRLPGRTRLKIFSDRIFVQISATRSVCEMRSVCLLSATKSCSTSKKKKEAISAAEYGDIKQDLVEFGHELL